MGSEYTESQWQEIFRRQEQSLRDNAKTKSEMEELRKTRGWFEGDLYCDKDDGEFYVFIREPIGWITLKKWSELTMVTLGKEGFIIL
jgi:hypothetical protein